MAVPLLYMWKGFEQATVYCMMGRRQHDILRRSLKMIYPASVVKKADAAAARAASGLYELPLALKQQIRGGSVLASLEKGPMGQYVQAAVVLNQPLQSFLSCAFSAEAETSKVMNILTSRLGPSVNLNIKKL